MHLPKPNFITASMLSTQSCLCSSRIVQDTDLGSDAYRPILGKVTVGIPAGRLLALRGHKIVDMLNLAEIAVAAPREGAAGTYSLAAFPSAARTFVAHNWRQLLQQPGQGLKLRLTESEPHDALSGLSSGALPAAAGRRADRLRVAR